MTHKADVGGWSTERLLRFSVAYKMRFERWGWLEPPRAVLLRAILAELELRESTQEQRR